MQIKNNDRKLFVVASKKQSIYTNRNKQEFYSPDHNRLRDLNYKNKRSIHKVYFHTKIISQKIQQKTENNANSFYKRENSKEQQKTSTSLRKVQILKSKSNFKTHFQKFRYKIDKSKNQNHQKQHLSHSLQSRQLALFVSQQSRIQKTKKISIHQPGNSMKDTRKNQILGTKYKFSLYTNNGVQENTVGALKKSKSTQKYKKIQSRSFTSNPFLKRLNCQKLRKYQNWQRQNKITTKLYQLQTQRISQKQFFPQNILLQPYNDKIMQQSKFFICKNCFQIFLIIQANSHNQLCQLISSCSQIEQKIFKIGALLKKIFINYYLERFKYRCYLDTSLLIQKILNTCKDKQKFTKNLKRQYGIQQFQTIMRTIEENLLINQLENKKRIFQSVHSIVKNDQKSLRPLLNQNDVFWLIGKLLQKLVYEKLNQAWQQL